MTHPVLSTIAQMLYPYEQSLDFARVVTEVERVLTRLCDDPMTIDWTCDDLVTFSLADTRILLAWAEFGPAETNFLPGDNPDSRYTAENPHPPETRQIAAAPPRRATCLTVAVGPAETGRTRAHDHAALCSQAVERIQSRFIPAAVLWREMPGRIEAEVIDSLFSTLPCLTLQPLATLPPVHTILDAVMRTDRAKISVPHPASWAKSAAPVPLQSSAVPVASAAKADGHPPTQTQMAPPPALPAAKATIPTPPSTESLSRHVANPNSAASTALQTQPPNALSTAKPHSPAPMPLQTVAPLAPPAAKPMRTMAAPLNSAAALPHQLPIIANDRPDLPYIPDAALARLRAALYPPKVKVKADPDAPSIQIRLAAHCFNATLILIWVPLGVAMLTYTLLRGEDVRLSARMIAITGTVLALTNSPVVHAVKAMAGIL